MAKADRAEHEKRRGVKQASLADLSRTKPNAEELQEVIASLETESDRGCALIAGSFLENTLEITIDWFLADCGEPFWKSLHNGTDAPLSTFSAKIKMARALGIYDEPVQKAFETVKDIRNAFAHALRPLDFSHPTIVTHCRKLDSAQWPQAEGNLSPARIRYTAFCVAMGSRLFSVAVENGGRDIPIQLTIVDGKIQTSGTRG